MSTPTNSGPALSRLVPASLRRLLRDKHRRWSLDAALTEFERNPYSATMTPHLFQKIVYGWSNSGWSCQLPYMLACIQEVELEDGLIVEAGSGITTLVLGAAARHFGREYIALEHNADWARRVAEEARKRNLDNVRVVLAPLVSVGNADWYDVSRAAITQPITFVICDGPPATTRGGRNGLMASVSSMLSHDAVILVDDARRPAESSMIQQWVSANGMKAEYFAGGEETYCRLKLDRCVRRP